VIAVLAAGATVTVRGATERGWVPVRCGDRDGWVSAEYLSVSTPSPGAGTGTVATGGARANCRAQPSLTGTVITSLANGSQVVVRGSRSGDWVPVRCANRDGWIHADLIRVTQ
jgi:mannosyl-glycoprotein endo-beta-N-acetylglucosaminidase